MIPVDLMFSCAMVLSSIPAILKLVIGVQSNMCDSAAGLAQE